MRNRKRLRLFKEKYPYPKGKNTYGCFYLIPPSKSGMLASAFKDFVMYPGQIIEDNDKWECNTFPAGFKGVSLFASTYLGVGCSGG